MKTNNRWIFVLIIVILLVVVYWFSLRKKSESSDNNYLDYDGDEYEGSTSYLGDYNAMFTGAKRTPAYSKTFILFKVTGPTNILRKDGERLVKTGRNYKKGVQIKIANDSLLYPTVRSNKSFVETIHGNFIRLDRIQKI